MECWQCWLGLVLGLLASEAFQGGPVFPTPGLDAKEAVGRAQVSMPGDVPGSKAAAHGAVEGLRR